jgi:hypothetical protein
MWTDCRRPHRREKADISPGDLVLHGSLQRTSQPDLFEVLEVKVTTGEAVG